MSERLNRIDWMIQTMINLRLIAPSHSDIQRTYMNDWSEDGLNAMERLLVRELHKSIKLNRFVPKVGGAEAKTKLGGEKKNKQMVGSEPTPQSPNGNREIYSGTWDPKYLKLPNDRKKKIG